MKNFLIFISRRLAYLIPQLVGVLLVAFILMKAIPGDPAVLMLGPNATEETLASLRNELGLQDGFTKQFLIFLQKLTSGDLGTSWQTTRPVLEDLVQRFPATLELVTLGLLTAVGIGVPLGVGAAVKQGIYKRIADLYGLVTGGLPDFWLGLVLIFIFYSLLNWAPAPFGRLEMSIIQPEVRSGFLLVDSLLAGDLSAFRSAVSHLVLPVLTLGLVSAGPILKMTYSMMDTMMAADFSRYQVLCGLPNRKVVKHAFRSAAPAIVSIVSVLYGYLLGGAVLVETVFSWGGAGQYAVQGVLNSDISPVLGFVLFASVFSLAVYLLIDVINYWIDPRGAH